MYQKNKKSIQEIILNFLHGKKAVKQKKLHQNIINMIEASGFDYGKTHPKYLITRTVKKMIQDGILCEHETTFSSFLSLTKTGRNKLRQIKLSSPHHLVSTDWDGYWRMIIIDIPEEKKSESDAVRYILKKAQFIQIKSSLWISPFPMEHIIIALKKDMNLDEEIMVFLTNTIDTGTKKILEKKFTESYNKKES